MALQLQAKCKHWNKMHDTFYTDCLDISGKNYNFVFIRIGNSPTVHILCTHYAVTIIVLIKKTTFLWHRNVSSLSGASEICKDYKFRMVYVHIYIWSTYWITHMSSLGTGTRYNGAVLFPAGTYFDTLSAEATVSLRALIWAKNLFIYQHINTEVEVMTIKWTMLYLGKFAS